MNDERIVIGSNTDYPLNGILTVPSGSNQLFPAVVLVHGSGPSNMDEKIGQNHPFKDLADGLAEKGIAVLRYDKRTFVYGKKMKNMTGLSVKEETIDDAIRAADFIRADSRIDANKIIVVGHSLGGMLAPRIDAEGGDFAGIVIMAGSPRKLEEILITQGNDVLKSLNKLLKLIVKKQITKLSSKLSNIYNLTDEEAKATSVLGKYTRAYYFKEMGERPSLDYLRKVDKPVLILQGDKDFQVTVERDFNGYKTALGDKPNVTFKLYPNLNHLLMPYVYGEILKAKKEYRVKQQVNQQVIEDIANWILAI